MQETVVLDPQRRFHAAWDSIEWGLYDGEYAKSPVYSM